MMNIRWNENADINGTSLSGYVKFASDAHYRAAVDVLERLTGQDFAAGACEDEPGGGMFVGELLIPGDAIPFTLYNRGYGTDLHIGLNEWDYRLDLMESLGAVFTSHGLTFTITRDIRGF